MRNKKYFIIGIVVILLFGIFLHLKAKSSKPVNGETIAEIKPLIGSIQNIISATGTVLPKNRLELKPPVSGRIEKIEVKEGDRVKTGQNLAWMSSTERAALLDAARGQGEETLKYWEEAYKAIPLISPINGEVIVATTQPGQTVTTSDAIIVLSDQLIIRAQVDETDIGKIKLGQSAFITLDAYPDVKISARVDHIYYESETVNNVTVYKVDLLPETVSASFRSGMNTTIDFVVDNKEGIVLLPSDAVVKEKNEIYVLVKQNGKKEPAKRLIRLGISDDKNVEVIEGVGINDKVLVKTKKYTIPKSNIGSNPFMPARGKR